MGYEIRLVIGELGMDRAPSAEWLDVWCKLDLSKCGYRSHINALSGEESPHPLTYWYEGGRRVTTDYYGRSLQAIPIKEVIVAIEADVKRDPEYRRFKWALAALTAMQDEPDAHVVLFGY